MKLLHIFLFWIKQRMSHSFKHLTAQDVLDLFGGGMCTGLKSLASGSSIKNQKDLATEKNSQTDES